MLRILEDNYFKDEFNEKNAETEENEDTTEIPEESESRSVVTEEEMLDEDNLTLSVDVSEIAVDNEGPELSELIQVVGRLPGPVYPGQYFRLPNYRLVFPARLQPVLYPYLPRLPGYHPRLIAPRNNYFARNLIF